MANRNDADEKFDHALKEQVRRNMTNHKPDEETVVAIEEIRELAKELAEAIVDECPHSRERSLAITHLEDCVMRAVQSLVTEGR